MKPLNLPQVDHRARSTRNATGALVFLLVLGVALLSPPGLPAQQTGQGPVLQNIVVLGLDETGEAVAREAVPMPLGKPLTRQAMLQLEERLVSSNLPTEHLKISLQPINSDTVEDGGDIGKPSTGAELTLDFRPPARIASISVFPLVRIDAKELWAPIPIYAGDGFTEDSLKKILDAIRLTAEGAGHRDVSIIPHHRWLSDREVELGFIVEGSVSPLLHKLRFEDAGFGHASAIRKFLKEEEEDPFSKGSPVTAARLAEVETMAANLMVSQGYLDATARLLETSVARKGLEIRYVIDRGPRYEVGATYITGAKIPDPEFWKPASKGLEGRKLTGKRVKELEEALEKRAQTRGYMAPEVELDFTSNRIDRTVAVDVTVTEGEKSGMRRVLIERQRPERDYGKSWYHRAFVPPVEESIIRKQVRVREGEELNRKLIEDAERRLWRLGTFDSVEVTTAATSDTLTRDVVVKVRDKRTGILDVGLGVNDQIGPVIRATFSEGNVGGRADRLTYSGFLGFSETDFGGEVSYLDRYWKLGEKIVGERREPSLMYSAFLTEYSYRVYSERRTGGRLRTRYLVGDPMGPWSNSWGARLEHIDYNPFRGEDDFEESFESYLAATLSWHLTHDTRDRGDVDSTSGLLFDTGLELGDADGTLIKWTNHAEWHRPISRHWGWVSRGQFGLMPYDAQDVGISDRFQSGGLDTIRGFEYRGIGPVDDRNEDLHIGGSTMTALQNEIRYIYNKSVEFPLFLDVGTLDDSALKFSTPNATAGLGIRMKLPGTEQRAYLYYGEQLLSEDTDEQRSLHFGLTFGL